MGSTTGGWGLQPLRGGDTPEGAGNNTPDLSLPDHAQPSRERVRSGNQQFPLPEPPENDNCSKE